MIHKYRAWDKRGKQFVYFSLFKGVNNYTPKIYEDAELEDWEPCTGLTDKDGVDLDWWEGDILQRNDVTTKYVIIFKDGAFRITFIEDGEYLIIFDFIKNNFKKIGNIHQNPELLTNQ